MSKKIAALIGSLIGAYGIHGGVATLCYNAIADKFNLPHLNFWVITGVLFFLNGVRRGFSDASISFNGGEE